MSDEPPDQIRYNRFKRLYLVHVHTPHQVDQQFQVKFQEIYWQIHLFNETEEMSRKRMKPRNHMISSLYYASYCFVLVSRMKKDEGHHHHFMA